MTGIKRNLAPLLHELLQQFPAVVILGARQTGKTTLAKTLAPAFDYFDLEQASDFQRINADPELFFKQHPDHVIFDEAQFSPGLFATLRGIIDEDRNKKGRFILTGSSSPALKKEASETLAGRVAIIELGTLKSNEAAQKPLSSLYQALCDGTFKNCPQPRDLQWPSLTQEEIHFNWFHGGYPEITTNRDPSFAPRWFQFYEDSYVNRDIATLFPQLNRQAYQRFLRILCHLSGTILNKSQLARDIETSEGAVRHYLDIVSGTFLWRQLESFEGSKTKSIVKMPRGHLRDSGLLHHMLKIPNLNALYEHPIVGRSFEGFVIEEILKGLATHCLNVDAYYYRTRAGAEIDLILEGPFGIIPIEIKYGVNTDIRKIEVLRDFINDNQLPFGILINQSKELTWLTPKIIQIPVGFL